MSGPQDDERFSRDDTTPSVPWDDSDLGPASEDVTQVVPAAQDGHTSIQPTAVPPPAMVPPPVAAPPAGSPWRQASTVPPPGAPSPYGASPAYGASPPYGAPPPGGLPYGAQPPGGLPYGSASPYGTPPPGGPPSGAKQYGAPWASPEPPRKRSRALWVILGLVGVAILAVIGFAVMGVLWARGPDLGELRAECEMGSAASCEELYQVAAPGSDEEAFGLTCGGRTDGTVDCTESVMGAPANSWGGVDDGVVTDQDATGPFTYGDDAYLDGLWDSCADGDMVACDDLYMESPIDSEYERFGDTCGDTVAGGDWCDPDR